MHKYFSAIALLCFFSSAHASIKVVNGTVTINVSGADGYYSGYDGSNAGQVNLNLAYAGADKKIAVLTGTTKQGSRTENINVQIPISELKLIEIYAIGGDGAQGSSGSSGWDGRNGDDGRDGSNGSDGCPPGNGSNGEDGRDGSSGSDGGNGGNGGDGGSGGNVQINAAPDQNELMLFVKTYTRGGYGGSGGYGGTGGSGGRAGRGGRAGSGGRNTCVDSTGKPTNGPDGSSGWPGRDGRDGSPGSNGRPGYDGSGGRSGGRSFNLVSANGTQSFSNPFQIEVASANFIDDLTDSILQPGERAHLVGVTLVNKSAMPSPVGQPIQLTLFKNSTMIPLATVAAPFTPLGGNANTTLTFKKGSMVFQVPDVLELVGKKAVVSARLNINGVALEAPLDTGMAIRWPASISAAATSVSGLFQVAKSLDFTLKNVGTQPLGPNGPQPIKVQFNWSSNKIPAGDVKVILADGRAFTLNQPAAVEDLSVPANGTAGFSVKLMVRDRALLNSASGTLTASLRMKDFNNGQDIVQSIPIAVAMSLDTKAIEWNQTVSFARNHVQCVFPKIGTAPQPLAQFQVTKAAGSDQIKVQIAALRSTNPLSPIMTISASRMLQYFEEFQDEWKTQTALDFLNKLVSPNSPEGIWNFRGCTAAP